jgi:hypothetical protein
MKRRLIHKIEAAILIMMFSARLIMLIKLTTKSFIKNELQFYSMKAQRKEKLICLAIAVGLKGCIYLTNAVDENAL